MNDQIMEGGTEEKAEEKELSVPITEAVTPQGSIEEDLPPAAEDKIETKGDEDKPAPTPIENIEAKDHRDQAEEKKSDEDEGAPEEVKGPKEEVPQSESPDVLSEDSEDNDSLAPLASESKRRLSKDPTDPFPTKGLDSKQFTVGNSRRNGHRDTQFYQVLNVSSVWHRNHSLSLRENERIKICGEVSFEMGRERTIMTKSCGSAASVENSAFVANNIVLITLAETRGDARRKGEVGC